VLSWCALSAAGVAARPCSSCVRYCGCKTLSVQVLICFLGAVRLGHSSQGAPSTLSHQLLILDGCRLDAVRQPKCMLNMFLWKYPTPIRPDQTTHCTASQPAGRRSALEMNINESLEFKCLFTTIAVASSMCCGWFEFIEYPKARALRKAPRCAAVNPS